MVGEAPLLWLCGPPGVGKSTVGFELYERLVRAGVNAAYVDADQIGLCHPAPPDLLHRVRARNLRAVWSNFRAAGAECLIFSGVVDTAEEARVYTEAVPDAEVTLCRLRADASELRERFVGRGWRPDFVDEALAAAEALDRTGFADFHVDTSGLPVPAVVQLVWEGAGLAGIGE
ncbi:AAA family ATPase [Actinomadura fulvescens]|uniref:Adenylyl-sulfate kinase n=1 Tax=Actinomadura fulvescens TaxID=46160 RepID=A0ABN3PID4_9ACTN